MYSRTNGDQTFTFDTSGGLLNASLVMMDNETDSHWSIITDEAIYGPAKGQRLEQVPGSIKTTFGDWKARHPKTWVLSVDGREHEEKSPYDSYFASDNGFRNTVAKDKRLADKESIFSFHYQGSAYAAPFKTFQKGGRAHTLVDGRQLFLYREKADSSYRSTVAFLAPEGAAFEGKKGKWRMTKGGETLATFDVSARSFGDAVAPFQGFDTFWYIWSLNNEGATILGK